MSWNKHIGWGREEDHDPSKAIGVDMSANIFVNKYDKAAKEAKEWREKAEHMTENARQWESASDYWEEQYRNRLKDIVELRRDIVRLKRQSTSVVMFNISNQSFSFYTEQEWKEAIAQMVSELEREEINTDDMGDYEIVEAWGGDNYFFDYLP